MLIVSYAYPKYLLIYSCITPASSRLHPKHWLVGFVTCYLNALLWQPQIRAIAWLLCYRGRSQVWSAWQAMSCRRTNKALPWRRHIARRYGHVFRMALYNEGDWRMETWQRARRASCHVSIRQSPSCVMPFWTHAKCLLAFSIIPSNVNKSQIHIY